MHVLLKMKYVVSYHVFLFQLSRTRWAKIYLQYLYVQHLGSVFA